MRNTLILLLAFIVQAGYADSKYTERMIPMRDGQALASDLYLTDSTVKKPTILIQTPYNKNLFRIAVALPQGGGVGLPYDSLKYNYVIVDWRGFYGSKDAGTGKPTYDRGLDGYDLVEWIAAQSWSDGKVGTWGGSALGIIQFQTAKHHPPHLVCAMPFIIDYRTEYQRYFPGGDFLREHYERLESLGLSNNALILQHPSEDIYWKGAQSLTDYPDSIAVPLLMVTGWFDHFPDAVIRAYEDLRNRSDAAVRDKHKLVIGPWLHTKVGAADQGILSYPEAEGLPTTLAFQFFGFYLRDEETPWEASPSVRYFDLGTHQWHASPLWADVTSASESQKYYLNDGGGLTQANGASATETFDYDPRDPSPSIGSSTFNDTLLHGPQDISQSIEGRNDVAIFTTDVLSEDLVVRGAIKIKLNVSTDRTDTDFGARLCDVYPDGRSVIITDAIRRLRFRNGYDKEELSTPGTTYPLEVDLRNLAMTFLKGHRLRIDITSSNFPRFDLNTNSGGTLYQPGDTLIAHNTLHLDGGSYLEIPTPSGSGIDKQQEVAGWISASPNPCVDMTALRIEAEKSEQARIDIFDAVGQLVSSENIDLVTGMNGVPVFLGNRANGTYFLRISGNKSGFVRVIKGFGP